MKDGPSSGRPVEADEDTIKVWMDVDHPLTTREIAERLNLSNSTVYAYLKSLDFKGISKESICDLLPNKQ